MTTLEAPPAQDSTEGPEITAPGVYDLSNEAYHADPVPGGSLSSTGARKLLPPSCPALFKHDRDHGRAPKAEFDFGHAAHKMVLGNGPDLVVVDADDWRTKKAQQQRVDARAAGSVPLLAAEYDQIVAMADAIRAHPVASALLHPDRGEPEKSLFWRDVTSGVFCRARLDWLPHPTAGRMIIADYKTCRSADPASLSKAVYDHGYHQQADWYIDAVMSLGITDHRPAFVFIYQEKQAPYLVSVSQLSNDALMWGGVLNAKARDLYRHCTTTGRWPGYSDDVLLTPLPAWAERQYDDARQAGAYDLESEK